MELKMMLDIRILTTLFAVFYSVQSQILRIRFCIPEDEHEICLQMAQNFPGSISCKKARDKFECMNLIARDEADIMNVDPEDLYLAGRLYNLEPFMMEEYEGSNYKYRATALVHRNSDIASVSDLRGKRSCHTGVGRAAGWNIPIGLLLSTNNMVPDCRSELHTVENFFDKSCAPGRWAADPMVDHDLKKQHSNLCALCKDPSTCSVSDDYAGYSGAIKCLIDGSGQVAFTTVEAVEKYFKDKPVELQEEYQYLCFEGTRVTITRGSCEWAVKPTNTFIIRKGKVRQKELYLRYLQQIFFSPSKYRPNWFDKTFVSSLNTTNLVSISYSKQSWDSYLGNYISSIEKPMPGCQRKNVTFCTTSSIELSKCLDLQKVAYVRRVRPDIRCLNPGDSRQACVEAIQSRKADFITLDAGDLYNASRYSGLQPIALERNNNSQVSYYAVAVIRAQSDVTTLEQLRGLKSCHTGFGRTSGWVAPVGALVEAELIPRSVCDRAGEVSKFFSGSCVPGAGDYRFNPNVTGASVLCKQCIGDENNEHACERSHSERYNGYAGALRCLAEGRGDVAFINHHTAMRYTDGKSDEFWARNLRSEDFRLLCRSGGQGMLNEYERCNLARVPSHFIAMAGNATEEEKLDVLYVLSSISNIFTKNSGQSFKLFGSYQNISDLLFSDITSSIISLPPDTTYEEALADFLPIIQDLDQYYCENHGYKSKPISLIMTIVITSALYFILI